MEKPGNQESYPMDFLKKTFSYNAMLFDYPEYESDIEYIMKILYDTLNSSQDVIRVQQTDRPRAVVVSQLMKLDNMRIIYVIQKYREQTGRIKNPKGYILTQLYDAAGQMDADILNQVNHDLHR